MVVNYPFTEEKQGDLRVRKFSADTDPEELIWHRDAENRTIHILECDGWYFQKEDELPIQLSVGDTINIPSGEWHRVLTKGHSPLIIRIESST